MYGSYNGYNNVDMQIPLIKRIKMGPQYCLAEEWEAYQWMRWKFSSFVKGGPNRMIPFVENLKHQSYYFGFCDFEVPFKDNPQRPWIVNALMCQMGARLHEYAIQNILVGVNGQMPVAVRFSYKTNEIGIVNDPSF